MSMHSQHRGSGRAGPASGRGGVRPEARIGWSKMDFFLNLMFAAIHENNIAYYYEGKTIDPGCIRKIKA